MRIIRDISKTQFDFISFLSSSCKLNLATIIIIKVTNWTPILIFKVKFEILRTYMYSTCIYKEM